MSRQTYRTAGMAEPVYPPCKLVQLDGSEAGQTHSLAEPEVVAGNGTDCDILVQHDTVSRRHFVISRGERSYMIRDLGSTNGTWVNGVRVKEAYLHPGVVIHAGRVSFRLEPI